MAHYNLSDNIRASKVALCFQSYLVAIAAGDLVSRKIGPRSRVWSEREFVDVAAHEFEDTEVKKGLYFDTSN